MSLQSQTKRTKTVEESDGIENHIVSLEKMATEGVDVAKTLATLRADLAKQKPKLPKTFQTLEDQARALEAVKECREKRVSVEKTLLEQRTKAQETQLQIADQLQTDLDELEKAFQDKKKMFTESALPVAVLSNQSVDLFRLGTLARPPE